MLRAEHAEHKRALEATVRELKAQIDAMHADRRALLGTADQHVRAQMHERRTRLFF